MRRVSFIVGSAALVLLCANGQVSRDAYRMAYRGWRQSDPNLEHDAGAGGPLLAQRAEVLNEPAKNYGVERSAFLQQLADETQRSLAWLELPPGEAPADVSKPAAARIAAEMISVKRNIDAYANDPDAGLQRVRMMLERENLALSALNNAILERQKMADVVKAATAEARTAQATALDKERELIAGLKQATADSDREKDAWLQYYRVVADAARGPVDSPATPVAPAPSAVVITPSSAAGPPPPVRTAPQVAAPQVDVPKVAAPKVAAPSEAVAPSVATPVTPTATPAAPPPLAPPETVTPVAPPALAGETTSAPPQTPAPSVTATSSAATQAVITPAPPTAPDPPSATALTPGPTVTPRPSITPVPLVRYTGAWTLPLTNPIYHGPQPETLELVVVEENGHASGTLVARFKLPMGVSDPSVSFSFGGDFRNTRNQVFELHANDGSGGRIELIPGPAFNLLEINFLVEGGPGKIRQANAILIKK